MTFKLLMVLRAALSFVAIGTVLRNGITQLQRNWRDRLTSNQPHQMPHRDRSGSFPGGSNIVQMEDLIQRPKSLRMNSAPGYITSLADQAKINEANLDAWREPDAFNYPNTSPNEVKFLKDVFQNYNEYWYSWNDLMNREYMSDFNRKIRTYLYDALTYACMRLRSKVGAITTESYDTIRHRMIEKFNVRGKSSELAIMDCDLQFRRGLPIKTKFSKLFRTYDEKDVNFMWNNAAEEYFVVLLEDIKGVARKSKKYKAYENGKGIYTSPGNSIYHPMDMFKTSGGNHEMSVVKKISKTKFENKNSKNKPSNDSGRIPKLQIGQESKGKAIIDEMASTSRTGDGQTSGLRATEDHWGYLTLLADYKSSPRQDLKIFTQNRAFDYDFTLEANVDYLKNTFSNFGSGQWSTWKMIFQSPQPIQDHIVLSFVKACQEIRNFVGSEKIETNEQLEKRVKRQFHSADRRSPLLAMVDCSLEIKEHQYRPSNTVPGGKYQRSVIIKTKIAKKYQPEYSIESKVWPDEDFAIILEDKNFEAFKNVEYNYKTYSDYDHGHGIYQIPRVSYYHPMDMIRMEEGTKRMTVLKYFWCWMRNRSTDPENPEPSSPYRPAYGCSD